MNIKKNQHGMLVRYNNYKYYSFIDEVKMIINEKGFCWFFKVGKVIPCKKVQDIVRSGGFIVLKAPKSEDDKYFFAHATDSYTGLPRKDMPYPSYYTAMINDDSMWMIESLEGTWIKIDYVGELTHDNINHLFLLSNNKPLDVVVHSTRSATMYLYSDIDLSLQ